RQRDALLDDLLLLVEDLPFPGDDAAAAARPRFLLQHLTADADRVADEDRPAELPVTDRQDSEGAHHWEVDTESARNGQNQQAVGDGPAERCRLRELMIGMDRVEVAAQAGEVDDICLRDRAAERQPVLADLDVVEKQMVRSERHGLAPWTGAGGPVTEVYKKRHRPGKTAACVPLREDKSRRICRCALALPIPESRDAI